MQYLNKFLLLAFLATIFNASDINAEDFSEKECNPSCPPGYYCDKEQLDCVPVKTETPLNYSKPAIQYSTNSSIGTYENYLTKSDIINTGLAQFIYSSVIYGVGTFYSSIAGITWTNRVFDKSEGNYCSYCDEYHYYKSDEAAVSQAPQSSVFLVFGALNQGAKSKQISMMNQLGIEPEKGFVVGGAILYGASLGTAALHITSYALQSDEINEVQFSKVTSYISAATLFTSYAVNITGYLVQRNKIKNELNKKIEKNSESKKVSVLPYIGYSEKMTSAGLALRF